MRIFRRIGSTATVAVLASCSADTISNHPEHSVNQQLVTVSSLTTVIYDGRYAGMHVSFNSSTYQTEIQDALTRWNAAFVGVDGAPTLSVNAASADYTIPLSFHETAYPNGTNWCGTIQDFYRTGSTCYINSQNNVRSDLTDLLTHEIGNNLGWTDLESHAQTILPNVHTVLAHCVMNAEYLNSVPCGYERQWLLYVHGTRDSVDLNSYMVNSASSSIGQDTMLVGDSAWMSIDYFPLDGVGGPATPSVPPIWSVDNAAVVAVGATSSTGAWVKAQGPGTTSVRMTVSRNDPTVAWHAEGRVQTSQVVTVLNPTPPVVASIDMAQATYYLGAGNPTSTNVYATAKDANGNIIPGVSFTWMLGKDDAVLLTNNGSYATVVAKLPGGEASIRAISGTVWSERSAIIVDCSTGSCLPDQ